MKVLQAARDMGGILGAQATTATPGLQLTKRHEKGNGGAGATNVTAETPEGGIGGSSAVAAFTAAAPFGGIWAAGGVGGTSKSAGATLVTPGLRSVPYAKTAMEKDSRACGALPPPIYMNSISAMVDYQVWWQLVFWGVEV